jgi:predicted porin
MNKKLVAVAVAGVLAAPLTAQAQTANVTLYGRLNLDLEYVTASGTTGCPGNNCTERPNVVRVSSNSSRFGLRGTESLGGGLNAIFQLESSVNGDAGGGTIAGRDTFVGLQGSWGTVKIGNFLAPYDDMHPIFGNVPTFTTSLLSTAALWSQGTFAKLAGGFDARLPNSIRYDSPNIAGFVGSIQASSFGETGRDDYVYSMGGVYNNGPFQGGLAYEYNEDVRGENLDDWAFSITAAWNFGIVRVAGLYERLQYDTPQGNLKRNFWGISGTGPLGPGTWYAFYGQANDGSGPSTQRVGGLTGGGDSGSWQGSLSYTYPLSKRTITYVGWNSINNEANASYNFNINPYTTVPNIACGGGQVCPDTRGTNLNGFVGGVVHFF